MTFLIIWTMRAIRNGSYHIIHMIWYRPYLIENFTIEPLKWWWTSYNRRIHMMNLLNLFLAIRNNCTYIINRWKFALQCVLFNITRITIRNGSFRDHTWFSYWFDIVWFLFRKPRFATWYWDEFSVNLNPPIG